MAPLSFRSHFHRDPDLSTGRAGNKGKSAVKKKKKKITAVWTVRGPEQALQVFFFLVFFQRSTLGFCLPLLQDSSLAHIAPTGASKTFAAGTAVDLCSAG